MKYDDIDSYIQNRQRRKWSPDELKKDSQERNKLPAGRITANHARLIAKFAPTALLSCVKLLTCQQRMK